MAYRKDLLFVPYAFEISTGCFLIHELTVGIIPLDSISTLSMCLTSTFFFAMTIPLASVCSHRISLPFTSNYSTKKLFVKIILRNNYMPYLPSRTCKHPGCQRLAGLNGYCSKHSAPPRDAARHRLYDRDWRRESKAYLSEHPWCVECLKQGKHVPATVVDHIKPHRGDRRLFWDRHNWQGLCEHHHDQKTARGE